MAGWRRQIGLVLGLLSALGPAACTSGDANQGDVAGTDTASDTAPADTVSSAILVVDPPRVDFPETPVGVPLIVDLELENVGVEPIVVDRIAFQGAGGEFGTNLLATEVPAGSIVTLKVTFYALVAGTHRDTLQLHSNASNGPDLGVPVAASASVGACIDVDGDLHGVGCAAGADCNEENDAIYVGATERCNAKDDNCNNLFDEDFVGLGSECHVGLGDCERSGLRVCAADGLSTTCDATAAPGVDELCNGHDDDCDGLTDEDYPSKGGLCSVGLGACRVVDKFICAPSAGGLLCPVTPRPASVEVCADGVDNDCDGVTDEGNIEVCGDDVDNDCDGQTDESGSRWGEVFVARDVGDSVEVYPSIGDGSFQSPLLLDFPGDDRFSVLAVADIDGDRWLDLVVRQTVTTGRTRCATTSQCGAGFTCAEGICRRLCTNDGQCTDFPLERCIDTRSHPVNQDTYCVPPSQVSLARSSCEQESISLTPLFTLAPGDVVGPVVDVDGNGHVDAVGLHSFMAGKRGFVWLNDGHGGYTQVSPAFDYGPLYGPGLLGHWQWGLAPNGKDLDGDGFVDVLGQSVASTDASTTGFWYLRSRGDGTFDPMTALGASIPNPANLTAVGDFDGDGDQDIVGGLDEDGQPGAAWILLNLGGSPAPAWVAAYEVFDLVPGFNVGQDKPGLGDGASYDFDGDHRPDILASWVPAECGNFIYGCTDVQDASDLCFGGDCRKVAFLKNITDAPCAAGSACVGGACVAGCTGSCEGRTCGSDGCGGSCGSCPEAQRCQGGRCVVDCVPDCATRQCGDDGCGGRCGECGPGLVCAFGACSDDCVPNCAGKRCGGDGCGGTCAIFGAPQVVAFDKNPHVALRAPLNVPPTRPTVAIEPANPGPNVDLSCVVSVASYDLDPVVYRYRWLRDGIYEKALGSVPTLPATLTEPGARWVCEVRGSDGSELSSPGSASAIIGQ